MTFKKVFNDLFKDELGLYGFQYNKKYGMHMRVVNNEIVQYITFISGPSGSREHKAFQIYAGMQSVYSYSLKKEYLLMYASVLSMYAYESIQNADYLMPYIYDEKNMYDTIRSALDRTKNVLIPIFDHVDDLSSYINLIKKIRIDILSDVDRFASNRNDALVLLKVNNRDDFDDLLQIELDRVKKWLKEGKLGGTYQEQYEMLHSNIIERVANARDKVYDNPDLYKKAMDEAERRKVSNLRELRNNGVEI